MRALELRGILRTIAVVTAVTLGILTMPNAIRAQQQTDEPTPVRDMQRDPV